MRAKAALAGFLLSSGLCAIWILWVALRPPAPPSSSVPAGPGRATEEIADQAPTGPARGLGPASAARATAAPNATTDARNAAPGELMVPVRGVVTALDDGRPLEDVTISVFRDGRAIETVSTARDGSFETQNGVAPGGVSIVADDGWTRPSGHVAGQRDTPPTRVELEWDAGSPPVEIALPAGPSFLLELDPEPLGSLDAYEVQLSAKGHAPPERASSRNLGRRVVGQEASSIYLSQKRSPVFYLANGRTLTFETENAIAPTIWYAGLRRSERGDYWARFRPLHAGDVPAESSWALTVASTDGSLRGTAALPGVPHGEGGTLRIALLVLTHVQVFAVDEEGFTVEGARAELYRVEADGARAKVDTLEAGDGRTGASLPSPPLGVFKSVPPGDYVLRGESLRTEPVERTLRLPEDAGGQVQLVMRRLPEGGTIEGWLENAAGEVNSTNLPRKVTLRRAGEEEVIARTTPSWGVADSRATFRFDRLPQGLYELGLEQGQQRFVWEHPTGPIAPPANGVRFVLRGDRWVQLRFEVVDALTGIAVEDFLAAYQLQDVPDMYAQPVFGVITGIDRDAELHWWVSTAEHRVASGTMADFVFEGDVGTARVELERGFSCKVVVLDLEGTPLQGARLYIGGNEVASSDANGHLEIELDEPPERLDIRYEADGVVYRHISASVWQLPYTPFFMQPQ